jgi:glyoxylase-like metal-dependent hydrolase (beta-lactamase superfamily II)
MKPMVESFFDEATSTFSYVVYEATGSKAIIIDPVLGYDNRTGRTSTKFIEQIIYFTKQRNLTIEWILETHAHADHLTAAPYLKEKLGGKIAIGSRIKEIQKVFKKTFNLGDFFNVEGAQFDYLLQEDEESVFGNLKFKVLFVPGHTPACVAYEVGDAIFVGDTLFMPDIGTARCDFPGGDAKSLFHSIQKILSRPDHTRLFMCHDYSYTSRAVAHETTVLEQKKKNIHIHEGVDEEAFVSMRTIKDKTLDMPLLIIPSIQVNINAGYLPPKEENGVAYLKIPLNLF